MYVDEKARRLRSVGHVEIMGSRSPEAIAVPQINDNQFKWSMLGAGR
jgi:hypothetical protein